MSSLTPKVFALAWQMGCIWWMTEHSPRICFVLCLYAFRVFGAILRSCNPNHGQYDGQTADRGKTMRNARASFLAIGWLLPWYMACRQRNHNMRGYATYAPAGALTLIYFARDSRIDTPPPRQQRIEGHAQRGQMWKAFLAVLPVVAYEAVCIISEHFQPYFNGRAEHIDWHSLLTPA